MAIVLSQCHLHFQPEPKVPLTYIGARLLRIQSTASFRIGTA